MKPTCIVAKGCMAGVGFEGWRVSNDAWKIRNAYLEIPILRT